MRKQAMVSAAVTAFLAIQLGSCRPAMTDLRSVVVAQFGDFFLYAPLYVAVDGGFTERNGLAVRIVSTGGDETTWATVLSGRAHFGVADPTFIAIAGQRGQPGLLVASLVEGVPFWGVTFKETVQDVRSPADLAGLVVATFPAPSTAFALQRKMFEDAGLRATIREAAPGALLPLARTGGVDIALELEPSVSIALAGGARIVYSLNDYYPDFAITGVTVAPATARSDSTLIHSFVCSLQQAFDFIRQRPDSTISILSRRFPEVDARVARDALERVVAAGIIPATPAVKPESWNAAVVLRQRIGDLAQPADYTTYVNAQYAERAARECRGGI